MATSTTDVADTTVTAPDDFSVMLGGPLYQLFRRTRLTTDGLALLHRRVLVLVFVAWVPLCVLSIAAGNAWDGTSVPFFRDLEVQIRLLLALPLLILAERVVHERMRPVARQFVDAGLILPSARPQFDAAVSAAFRLRNSVTVEVALIAAVYVIGVGFIWRTQLALAVPTWYGHPLDGRLHPTLAGWWLGCVSLPIFQFLLLRWYFRVVVWARFLLQVSRIKLALIPTHPDRSGGLGFLAMVSTAFAPLLAAEGFTVAAVMVGRIMYAGATFPQFKLELAGIVVLVLCAVLGPLLAFSPQLAEARRTGLREYGAMAQRYVRTFDRKWLRGPEPVGEPLLGSSDIQSLADLGNSYAVVNEMRATPFSTRTIIQLGVVTLAPIVPVSLTMISPQELLDRILKLLF